MLEQQIVLVLISQFTILSYKSLTLLGMYVYYRHTLETVDGRKEMKTSIIVIILGTTMPLPRPASFLTLLDRPNKPNEDSKSMKAQINVSGLLVFYWLPQGKFAPELEMNTGKNL